MGASPRAIEIGGEFGEDITEEQLLEGFLSDFGGD